MRPSKRKSQERDARGQQPAPIWRSRKGAPVRRRQPPPNRHQSIFDGLSDQIEASILRYQAAATKTTTTAATTTTTTTTTTTAAATTHGLAREAAQQRARVAAPREHIVESHRGTASSTWGTHRRAAPLRPPLPPLGLPQPRPPSQRVASSSSFLALSAICPVDPAD
ncbi:hypothetical protein HN011_004563 [Eciton burchellii]|nr:hypothetical protein HN011_004563 [Eciton burchellii]